MRTVVFDLDGTLADTAADLVAAANATFRGRGLGDLLDPVADAATAHRGGRPMLRLGFARAGGDRTEAEVDAAYPDLLAHYEEAICRESRLYPGAAEAVEALLAAGYAAAICTNKPERLAETLMARLGVRGLFGALVGADTLNVRKPDPAPYLEAVRRAGGTVARSVMIGDTETDLATARAAGRPCVLVTFGPNGAGVAELGPEALMAGYGELAALADRLA